MLRFTTPVTLAVFALLAGGAGAYEVVLIRPNAYLTQNPGKVDEASQFLGRARALLDYAGVEHHTLNEEQVLAEGLPEGEFLLCAYNPEMPRAVEETVLAFLARGGHGLFCYYLPDRLREALMLAPLQYAQAGDGKTMEYLAAGPQGLRGQPRRVLQASWNAHLTAPTDPSVRMAARWSDPAGRSSPGSGLLVGPRGAFLGHVLTDGDTANKSALLVSVVSHYISGTWELVAQRSINRTFQFRHAPSLAAFEELCDTRYTREQLERLKQRRHRAEVWLRTGRASDAAESARAIREDAGELYLRALPTRKREFRGAWVVMPGGVGDWGWERTAQVAKRCGLNALFVRVEWRGEAHYKSSVLRMAEEVQQGGDPLAEAIEACRRHGLEVHAWFINHNWRTPPRDLIEEFSRADRWQIAPDGRDGVFEGGDRVYWLNPSDPRNVKLQADMMAEVVREYGVDGVHFDYIRYENYSGSYGRADRQRFERDTGLQAAKWPEDVLPRSGGRQAGPLHEAFLEWRVDQISNVVRACSEAVRAADPDCELSAAVYPSWPSHRRLVGQDWPRWLDEGWIDFVCPMNYDAPGYYGRHEQRVIAQREAAGSHLLYSGIGSWLQPDAIAVADQIITDRANGADGFLLFSFTPELGTDVLPKLRIGPLRSRTVPPDSGPRTAASPRRTAVAATTDPDLASSPWLRPRVQ